MRRRLLHVSKVRSFTNEETGEIITGGYISICMPESVSDDTGIGLFTETIWISKDIIEKLTKKVNADILPHLVEIVTEQRTIKGKTRIVDVQLLED